MEIGKAKYLIGQNSKFGLTWTIEEKVKFGI
jgi:hypothetical protein